MAKGLLRALEEEVLTTPTADVETDELQSELGLAEIDAGSDEVEQIEVSIDNGMDGAEALESLIASLESIPEDKYDASHAKLGRIGFAAAVTAAGMSYRASNIKAAALEGYTAGKSQRQVALEESDSMITRIWEAIKAALAKFWSAITSVWDKIMGWFRGSEKKVSALKERFGKVKGKGVEVKLSDKQLTGIIESKTADNLNSVIECTKAGIEGAKDSAECFKEMLSVGKTTLRWDKLISYYKELNTLNGKVVIGGAKINVVGVDTVLSTTSLMLDIDSSVTFLKAAAAVKVTLVAPEAGSEVIISASEFDSAVESYIDNAETLFKHVKECDKLVKDGSKLFTFFQSLKLKSQSVQGNFGLSKISGGSVSRVLTNAASQPISTVTPHMAKTANAYLRAAEQCIKAAEASLGKEAKKD